LSDSHWIGASNLSAEPKRGSMLSTIRSRMSPRSMHPVVATQEIASHQGNLLELECDTAFQLHRPAVIHNAH